jgi:hypothetical protein
VHTNRAAIVRGWLLALATCVAPPVATADRSLHGIDTVLVRYDGIGTEFAPYGLDRGRLESSIDELLRNAGIRVLHGESPESSGAVPTVTVSLRLQTTPYQFYLYNVKLTLETPLPLPADGAWTMLPTWSEGETGEVQPDELGRLHDTALRIVQRFLGEHAAQNG